jgi:predicted dehydrogenase
MSQLSVGASWVSDFPLISFQNSQWLTRAHLFTATGLIAQKFAIDILLDPKSRSTKDIIHSITAVASSTSIASAQRFYSEYVAPTQLHSIKCATYGSYEELVKDANVDILYIATPHSHHFQNCMLALNAGQAILCEKPITVNATQAKVLYQTAKEKNLFLMEAVWTRFFPLCKTVRKYIQDGVIGDVLRVTANNNTGVDILGLDPSHRYLSLDLAGGALLDIGIYSLTWLFQTLYHTMPEAERKAPSAVLSLLTFLQPSGVDDGATTLIKFPRAPPHGVREAHGIATSSMILPEVEPDKKRSDGPQIHIYGLKGEIQVFGPTYRPESIKIIPMIGSGDIKTENFEIPGGYGMYWEADEAARCLRDGKLETEVISWEESTLVMEVLDKIRSQNGVKYPKEIESTEYPLDLGAKASK